MTDNEFIGAIRYIMQCNEPDAWKMHMIKQLHKNYEKELLIEKCGNCKHFVKREGKPTDGKCSAGMRKGLWIYCHDRACKSHFEEVLR